MFFYTANKIQHGNRLILKLRNSTWQNNFWSSLLYRNRRSISTLKQETERVLKAQNIENTWNGLLWWDCFVNFRAVGRAYFSSLFKGQLFPPASASCAEQKLRWAKNIRDQYLFWMLRDETDISLTPRKTAKKKKKHIPQNVRKFLWTEQSKIFVLCFILQLFQHWLTCFLLGVNV